MKTKMPKLLKSFLIEVIVPFIIFGFVMIIINHFILKFW